jgi:hypothetical protein
MPTIVFLDMKQRNDAERQRLLARQSEIQLQADGQGNLPPDLQAELEIIELKLQSAEDALATIQAQLGPNPNRRSRNIRALQAQAAALQLQIVEGPPWAVLVVDPLYGGDRTLPAGHPDAFQDDPPGVREVLSKNISTWVGDHTDGVMPSQAGQNPRNDLLPPEKALAAVYGIMEADNQIDPNLSTFVGAVSVSLGEYRTSQQLFDNVLAILVQRANNNAPDDPTSEVLASEWVQVARMLRDQGVSATDPYLQDKTISALMRVEGTGGDAPPSAINIDLPDLEAQTDVRIQADNIRAMQAIFFAGTLEDLKMFQVVDKLVEQFQNGTLPLGKSNASNLLYRYWKNSVNRFTEIERRNLYARTFGMPGGEASVETINREFDDLWIRFISAVSSYVRQFRVDDLLQSRVPFSVSQEQVRKAGRDLAANLSLHGYGIAYCAATDLQTQIGDIITLLSDPDIRTAYGARDMWQVIDQVATLELGGAKNSVRYRTMATSGAIIIRWLAERAALLSNSNQVQIIDISQIRTIPVRPKGSKATVNPTDRDMMDACDQWLAVTGTQEKSVEEYAQPTVGPNLTSRPIQIPRVAQDLLASVGIKPNGILN